MQNQYTRQAERAIKYAARMARKLKHPYIGTEHLLLGLRSEITGVAGQVLASHGVDEEQLLHLMDELIVPGEEILQQDDPKESPRLEYILENAKKEALHLRTGDVGTEHLLLAHILQLYRLHQSPDISSSYPHPYYPKLIASFAKKSSNVNLTSAVL